MKMKNKGCIGIDNDAPIANLCLGNSSIVNSDGILLIGKSTAVETSRHFQIVFYAAYHFCIGEYGANNTAGTWLKALP